jgi:hypothetical protein
MFITNTSFNFLIIKSCDGRYFVLFYTPAYYVFINVGGLSCITKSGLFVSLRVSYMLAKPDTVYLNTCTDKLFKLFFFKIKFFGKGYKLFANNNLINTQLGFSHALFFKISHFAVRVFMKTKFYFFGLSNFLIRRSLNLFVYNKRISVYSGNGLRFSKQLVYKKVGKVSMYF